MTLDPSAVTSPTAGYRLDLTIKRGLWEASLQVGRSELLPRHSIVNESRERERGASERASEREQTGRALLSGRIRCYSEESRSAGTQGASWRSSQRIHAEEMLAFVSTCLLRSCSGMYFELPHTDVASTCCRG